MNKNSKAMRNERNRTAIAGMKKHLATTPSIPIGDLGPMTPAEIEQALQAPIDAAGVTVTEETAFHKAVAAENAAAAHANAVFKGFKAFLLAHYLGSPEVLADCGVDKPKRRARTPQVAVQAAAKAKATRSARHTMGPRQKALPSFHEHIFGGEILLEAVA
jgi:hypothetical protein